MNGIWMSFEFVLEKNCQRTKKSNANQKFESTEEFEEHVAEAQELIFDRTENLTMCPQGYKNQKEKYSGGLS